jgi:hypothetical protein
MLSSDSTLDQAAAFRHSGRPNRTSRPGPHDPVIPQLALARHPYNLVDCSEDVESTIRLSKSSAGHAGPARCRCGLPTAPGERAEARSDVLAAGPRMPSSRHWSRWGSNPLPPGCKPGALPTELRPRRLADSGLEPLRPHSQPLPGPPRPCSKTAAAIRSPRTTSSVTYTRQLRGSVSPLGPAGVEPATSSLSATRSNQLSYEPAEVASRRDSAIQPISARLSRLAGHRAGRTPFEIPTSQTRRPRDSPSRYSLVRRHRRKKPPEGG